MRMGVIPIQPRGLVVLNACQTAEEGKEGSFMEALHDAGLSGMGATEFARLFMVLLNERYRPWVENF